MSEPAASGTVEAGPLKVWFLRAFDSTLSTGKLLPDERTALEVERIHGGSDELARLLLWRRAALFVALVFLAPTTLIQLIKSFIALGKEGGASDLAGLGLLVVLGNIALCFAVFGAFRRWDRWLGSRRVLFWTWLVAFLLPFLTALFPLRSFARQQGIFGEGEVLIGMIGALNAVLELAPKALSLVPGLLRAALTTKSLFPGASAPGWLILLGTPFYMLLVFVILLMPYQMSGGGLMALAVVCFLGAPIFLIRAGRQLSRPMEVEPVHRLVKATRLSTLLLNLFGGLFLFIGLIDMISALKLSAFDAILPLIGVVANVLVLSVIGTDTLMSGLMKAHVSQETPEQAALRFTYDEQLTGFMRAHEHTLGPVAGVDTTPPGGQTSLELPRVTPRRPPQE